MRAALFAMIALRLCGADAVAHRQPVAASIFPMGSPPGQTFEAEILGEFLDRAQRVLFHDSGLSADLLHAEPTKLRLRVHVAKDAAWGPHPFHIITPRGASAPLLFRVGDQPHVLEAEPNSTLAEAQSVALPVTIQGRLNVDGDFDFYRFHAAKGSHWIFDLRAARNGNGLDAALFLLDAKGRKIDYSEERFIWDPFLTHRFEAEGDYVVVVQPTHRNNDPNFAYQLDIRQSPYLETLSPLSITPAQEQEVTIHGEGLYGEAKLAGVEGSILAMEGATARARIRVPADAKGVIHLSLLTPGGRSNAIPVLIDPAPRHTGGERITPPVSITGAAKYREPDRYKFHAQAGQTLVFDVRGQRFGSPVDLTMRLLDASGKAVAQNDDFTYAGASFYQRDPRLMHTFDKEGEFTIELRNVVNVSGENHPYQLVVAPPRPSYEIEFGNERPHVPVGGTTKWKVSVQRLDGHKEALPLVLEGLPDGITASPAIVPEGKNDAEIELKADASAVPGTSAWVTLRAGSRNAWRSVRVSSGGGEGATFTRVDRAVVVVSEPPHFSLEAQAATINIPRGGSASIPLSVRWADGFNGEVHFRLDNLPPGVTLEPASVRAGVDKVELKIRAAADAPTGRAPRVAILGKAGAELQEAPRITVQVD